MSDCGGDESGGCANQAASCDDNPQNPTPISESVPTSKDRGSPTEKRKSAGEKDTSEPLGDSQEDAAHAAVVHFQENATTEDAPPRPTTLLGKIWDWCDCDTVWVGCLLVGTGVAFIIFIVFIISG